MTKSKLSKLLVLIGAGILSMSMLGACATKPLGTEDASVAEAPTEVVEKTPEEAPVQEDGKYIVMGTNAEFPPFEYRSGGQIIGFDIEIAKAIAEKAGKELKIEDMAFDTLIVGLNNDQMDFIAAGMSVTKKRKTQVDFSDPYFKSKQMIIVKSDNTTIQSADDLVGKTVGVQLGTTGDLFVSGTEGVKVIQFDKAPLAVMDLVNGKVDAVVIDAEPAKRLVGGRKDIKVLDVPFTEEEYAIAVKKGDTELLSTINTVIAELKESGRYEEIYNQFFEDKK